MTPQESSDRYRITLNQGMLLYWKTVCYSTYTAPGANLIRNEPIKPQSRINANPNNLLSKGAQP